MEQTVAAAVQAWLDDPAVAAADKTEIHKLQVAGNEQELTDRFYRDLEFGTGGLRGIMGAGLNRMNLYTVGAAAQGLANYIAGQGEAAKRAGVAIAYDCRHNSDGFARRVACVMAGNGITAQLFEALRPTPELSFAVRHLGCTAGVVITASHNPPQYNGFKAYWSDGGQVVPPHDQRIIDEVRRVGSFGNIRTMDYDQAQAKGVIRLIGRDVDEAYLAAVQASCLSPDVCRSEGARLKVVFTALHGSGGTLTPEALRRRGFRQVIEVPEQAKPDGSFPTVESPNPEEPAALDLALALARREGADLVIGTDPDADRMGMAFRRPDGEFELLTGNRIAALLTYYLCEQLTRSGRFPKNAVLVTTIVSGDMMKDIARSYGAEVVEVLTGFKWIAEKIRLYEEQGTTGEQFIFGAEESYGYLPAAFTRDKDAVASSAFITELAAVAAGEGKTLYTLLQELFKRFGYYQEGVKNITMPGKEGAARIKRLMERLRAKPPRTFGGVPVIRVGDVMTGLVKDARTGAVVVRYDLPQSDVVLFMLEDGAKVIARPSGTEPKIKFYVLANEKRAHDLDGARASVAAKIDAILAEVAGLATGLAP